MQQERPEFEALFLEEDSSVYGRLGVIVSPYPRPTSFDAGPEQLAKARETFGPDWQPVDGLLDDGAVTVWDCALTADDGGQLVDGSSKGRFALSESDLVLCLTEGGADLSRFANVTAHGTDGKEVSLKGSALALVGRWPLRTVASIEIVQAKKMFKLFDAQLTVTGSYSGGSVRPAWRCGQVKAQKGKGSYGEMSDMRAYAHILADAVRRIRGSDAQWSTSDGLMRISFE